MVSALRLHVLFMTNYRRGVPGDAMLSCCQRAMRKICADFGAELRDFNGKAGHAHLLGDYLPKVAVSALVNSLNPPR